MTNSITQPPGEKVARALKEFTEELELKPEKKRKQILQEIVLKHDLSPKEASFLERHFSE